MDGGYATFTLMWNPPVKNTFHNLPEGSEFVSTPSTSTPSFGYTLPPTYLFYYRISYNAQDRYNLDVTLALDRNKTYVAHAYKDLLGRDPDASGLNFWSGLLDQNQASHLDVALALEASDEYHTAEVQAIYQSILARKADDNGLTNAKAFLANGGTIEQLKSMLLGSQEYATNISPPNNDGFLDSLFFFALNRMPDDSGRSYYDQQLANGVSRGQVAIEVLTSTEAYTVLVAGFYGAYLRIPPKFAGGGTDFWVSVLQNGNRDEGVIAGFVGSDGYFFDG